MNTPTQSGPLDHPHSLGEHHEAHDDACGSGSDTPHSISSNASSSATVTSSVLLSSTGSETGLCDDALLATPTRLRSQCVEVEHVDPSTISSVSSHSSLSPTAPYSEKPISAASQCCLFVKSAIIVSHDRKRVTTPLAESDSTTYTAFRIRVSPKEGASWNIERRYTDFVELKRRLRQSCPLTAKFPRRLLTETAKGIQERERLLNRFLAIAIAAVPQFPTMRYCMGSFLQCAWATRWQPPSLMPKFVSESMALFDEESQDRGSICILQHLAAQELRRLHSKLQWQQHDQAMERSVSALPWVAASIVGRKEAAGNPTVFEILVTAENGNEWVAQRRYSDFVVLREYTVGYKKDLAEADFPPKTLFRCSKRDLDQRETGLSRFLTVSIDAARGSEHMRRLLSVFLCAPSPLHESE